MDGWHCYIHSMDMSNNMFNHQLNYDCTETVLLHPLVDLTRYTAQACYSLSDVTTEDCG